MVRPINRFLSHGHWSHPKSGEMLPQPSGDASSSTAELQNWARSVNRPLWFESSATFRLPEPLQQEQVPIVARCLASGDLQWKIILPCLISGGSRWVSVVSCYLDPKLLTWTAESIGDEIFAWQSSTICLLAWHLCDIFNQPYVVFCLVSGAKWGEIFGAMGLHVPYSVAHGFSNHMIDHLRDLWSIFGMDGCKPTNDPKNESTSPE